MKNNPISNISHLIHPSISRILVTVSGGADSVALLHILAKDKSKEIFAVHCNFHLRDDESDRDQKFVENLCQTLDIPLDIVHFDVHQYCNLHHVSIEMACRELRYKEFHRLKNIHKCQRIALAHHLDDNIETVLLNLLRGTGIKGMCGMDMDDGTLLRPLINCQKNDILEFLRDIGQPFVTDSSNLISDVKRNFLRNEIIPLLAQRWPGLKKSFQLSISNFKADSALLNHCLSSISDDNHLPLHTLQSFPHPQSLIHHFIAPQGGNSSQAKEITGCILSNAYPRQWHTPKSIITLDRDGLSISHPAPQQKPIRKLSQIILDNTPETIAEIKQARDNNTLYSPIPLQELTIRHPRNGDRISPLGMKGSSLVSDILKDAHLTMRQREEIILATTRDGDIIWIQGLKRSALHLIQPSHKYIYKIFSPQ